MDKYYKEKTLEESRTAKNKEIYNNSGEEEYDKLSLTSNISILDTDTTNLDIEKLKQLLDEKYSNNRSKKKVESDDIQEREPEKLDDTKEYDLKKIIEEAHNNKSSDYDVERFKKLRDTQYDILNSLNLDRKTEPEIEESLTVEEANLMNLIKTVNGNAIKKEQIEDTTANDLMDDLKGDDNTEVLAPVVEEEITENLGKKKPTIIEELEKTKQLNKKAIIDEINKEEHLTENTEVIGDTSMLTKSYDEDDEVDEDKSPSEFYTGKFQIKDSDMDDFDDLQKEMKSGGIFIKILIILVVVLVLFVGVYLLNKYLNLGLF